MKKKTVYNQLQYLLLPKRCLPAIPVLSTSHALFMKFTMGKSRQASFQPAFKLCDFLELLFIVMIKIPHFQ